MDRIEKLYGKWKDKLLPIFEETKNIETEQEWQEWVKNNPEKSATVMAAFLEVTAESSIFRD